jgi:hypothetical protein
MRRALTDEEQDTVAKEIVDTSSCPIERSKLGIHSADTDRGSSRNSMKGTANDQ